MNLNKNIIVGFIFFFIFNLGYAQINNYGIATYKIKPMSLINYKDKKNKLPDYSTNYFKKREENRKKLSSFIEYKLKFNKDKSIFFMEDIMKSDNKIGLGSFYVGHIYTDSKIKLREREQYGDNFIISSNVSDVKWKLTSETKKIGEFNCYKATTIKKIINTKGVFYRNITAWYCPNVTIPFGPMGYGNLPGLIIELIIDKKGIYTLNKLNLNPKKKIVVKMPTKGTKVTEKEFNEVGKKVFKEKISGM